MKRGWSFLKQPIIASLSTLVVCLMLTYAAWTQFDEAVDGRLHERFAQQTSDIQDTITDRFSLYVETLRAGQVLFATSGAVDAKGWKKFVDRLGIEENVPGMIGMGYIEVIPSAHRAARELEIRRTQPRFTITPEGARDTYTPVVFLEPLSEANAGLIGYDVSTSPVRADALSLAERTGEPEMTGPLDLGIGRMPKEIPGVIIYLPVSDGTSQVKGYVFGRFPYEQFTSGVSKSTERDIDIHIYAGDATHMDEEHLVYETEEDESLPVPKDFDPHFKEQRSVTMYGQTWTFLFHSLPAYEAGVAGAVLPQVVLGEGIAVSILAACTLFVLVTRRERAERLAEAMTKDLAASKKEVEDKYAETERMNKLMVERELKMIELKEELKKQSEASP